MIALADLKDMDEGQVKDELASQFNIERASLDGCQIEVAYISVGDYGCDSSAFIVFRRDGELYEVNGSHCSCHGFGEQDYSGTAITQWQPEHIPVECIKDVIAREEWSLAGGGYDYDKAVNAARIREHLTTLLKE